MKSASVAELKKELKSLSHPQLLEICMRLAKYKKDNKELLTYLVFEAENEQTYLSAIKAEMDDLFEEINYSNAYLAKKGLRKILRNLNKYIRYSGIVETEIEALIYFCKKIKNSRINTFMKSNQVLANLYEQQLKKINKAIGKLHEDLQYDYTKEMQGL
ncbi:MAG TPA: hypothetical protein VNB90_09935 [Cytophagaceae bacterium]|nr:hypothetical protein [Cytophagaceae bacterium]